MIIINPESEERIIKQNLNYPIISNHPVDSIIPMHEIRELVGHVFDPFLEKCHYTLPQENTIHKDHILNQFSLSEEAKANIRKCTNQKFHEYRYKFSSNTSFGSIHK